MNHSWSIIGDSQKIFSHQYYPLFSIVVTKLFKMSLINKYHLRFSDMSYGEDSKFMIEYLHHCSKIYSINYVGYVNEINSDSISHNRNQDVWKQAVRIPNTYKKEFELVNYWKSSSWQYLYLRAIKLSLLSSSQNKQLFITVFKKLVDYSDTKRLRFCFQKRINDLVLLLLIKMKLKRLLFRLFRNKK